MMLRRPHRPSSSGSTCAGAKGRSSPSGKAWSPPYSIIYDVVDDIKSDGGAARAHLKEVGPGKGGGPQHVQHLQDRDLAGCGVISGKITRNSNVRLLRDNVVVYEGKLSSLKRFKDDVREVLEGFECGLGIENYNDIQVGDQVEAYTIEKIAGTLA